MADKTITYKGNETVLPEKPMSLGNGLKTMPVTAAEQVVVDFATDKRLPEYLEEITSMDLLWTNASADSAFSEQKLSLDLSKYSLIHIVFRLYKSGRSVTHTLPVNSNATFALSGFSGWGNDATYIYFRIMNYITTSGIEFGGGGEKIITSTTTTSKNDVMIPFKIYGIK